MASSSCKVRVCVDLDFDDLMNPRVRMQGHFVVHFSQTKHCHFVNFFVSLNWLQDIGKCVKQMMRCYTLNRRTENPLQLYFSSFNGKSEQEMSKNNGYLNWDVCTAKFIS